MSDEKLWRPSVRQGSANDETVSESLADADVLFDTTKWRPDKNDATNAQLKAGLVPMWRPAEDEWDCKYDCPGITFAGLQQQTTHSWNCPFWWKEGKNKTPF